VWAVAFAHAIQPPLQGTASLALRIGLNSGPTVAGVLRGEKSRFQLFGDVSESSYRDMEWAPLVS
jgi:class 3 adenylate cyclase